MDEKPKINIVGAILYLALIACIVIAVLTLLGPSVGSGTDGNIIMSI